MKWQSLKGLLSLCLLVTLFSACHKPHESDNPVTKDFTVMAFDKIVTAETFKLHITKGRALAVQARGSSEDIADLQISVNTGRALKLEYKNFKRNRSVMTIEVTMPELLILNAGGTTQIDIDGMTGQADYMWFVLSGTASCKVNGTTSDIIVDLSGDARLNLSGTATDLITGDVSGTAKLDAYSLPAGQVDLTTEGISRSYVMPVNKLLVDAGGASIVYYKGNPPSLHTMLGGTAKVIKQ